MKTRFHFSRVGLVFYLVIFSSWAHLFSFVSIAVEKDQALTQISTFADAQKLSEAQQFLRKQQWPEAIGLLRTLKNKYPDKVSVVLGLSTALVHTGERAEAITLLLGTADSVSPSQRKLILRRARVLSRLFVTNRAFELYQEGFNAFDGKKYRLAQEKLEKVLSDEPNHFEALMRLGQTYFLENDFEMAVQKFKLAKKINPTDPEASLWLGKTYLGQGKVKESLVELEAVNADIKGFELATLWLAEARAQSGQIAGALRLLEKDVKEHPMHLQSLLNSAKLRTQGPRTDKESLWQARKDLQLVLSRLSLSDSESSTDWELSAGFLKSSDEVKADIQKLFLQIQGRIDEASHR